MSSPRQLRLLLWKDYLIRKRKLITLGGIVWATAVVISLYIVRANVDNLDFPSCQFTARALPSAGMLGFLQSFVCSVNNECDPLDQYEEIPTYENARLTQLQRQLSPLLYNDTVLDTAATVPDALHILQRLALIVDEPTFIHITKNGLQVQDLFSNPPRAKRYLTAQLDLPPEVADDLMTSQLSIQGLMSGQTKCTTTIPNILLMKNDSIQIVTEKVCSLKDQDVQKIVMRLMGEIDFSKYIGMVGNMYYKLSGDDRLRGLGDTIVAVLRMTKLQSFLPAEALVLLGSERDFSYFDLDLITKLVDLFRPTFGDTDSFMTIKDFADTIVGGLKFLSNLVNNESGNVISATDSEVIVFAKGDGKTHMELEGLSDPSIDVFSLLAQVSKLIYKYLPDTTQHEFSLYSTLLAKLIEGANQVVVINMHIEERAYKTSLRHSDAIKILTKLPSHIVAKTFDGLADAERTQKGSHVNHTLILHHVITSEQKRWKLMEEAYVQQWTSTTGCKDVITVNMLTSKINKPAQVFCNANVLQEFFKTSKDEANMLKTQLCNDAWNNYVGDLVQTFGVFDVRDKINDMASLLIQETLGKKVTDQLYSIEHCFEVLKNFTQTLRRVTTEEVVEINWNKLLNVSDDSDFMRVIRSKAALGMQILVVIHGSLAKAIVSQNAILSFKLSPILIDTTTLVTALNSQLDTTPELLVKTVKDIYPQILETVLRTANDVDKTYKSLSTHSEDIMCNGTENAQAYLDISHVKNPDEFLIALCNLSRTIENGMKNDSIFGKAVDSVNKAQHAILENVKWTNLINGIKSVYVKLYRDYPYLFMYGTYGMNENQIKEVEKLAEGAKKLWFSKNSIERSIRLALKLGFRLLDLVDRDIWNVTASSWLKLKYAMFALSGPVEVFDDFVSTVAAISNGTFVTSNLPPRTVHALKTILPGLPQLIVDAIEIIVAGNTPLEPILSILNADPPWPCSLTGLSTVLPLSQRSATTLTSLETLMCVGDDFRSEWRDYLGERNIISFDIKQFNTTAHPPHTFLKFSSALDKVITDGNLLQTLVKDLSNDTFPWGSDVSWSYAWGRVLELFERSDKEEIFGNFFSRLDTILPAIKTTAVEGSLFSLWREYLNCEVSSSNDSCRSTGRNAWKYTLQFFSVLFSEAADDLLVYFKEVNEPSSTLLQLVGFTKRTPLYDLYNRLGDYMAVLLNSYWDYGFMSQIRKAALTQFWDCEGIINALVPPPGSSIDANAIEKVQPFICPSFLYWLSLPKGENTLLDVIAKSQYYFYTIDANNLTSKYKEAYKKINELSNFLEDVSNKSKTLITEDDIKMNSLQYKYEKLVNTVLNYTINTTDVSYKNFIENNKKQFALTVYLTRIVAIVNKIDTTLPNLNVSEEIKTDSKSIETQAKRRPDYYIAVHFDLITEALRKNDGEDLVTALENRCNNNSSDNKVILMDGQNVRVMNVICSKKYKDIYTEINGAVSEDIANARESLMNLVRILRNGENDTDNIYNVFEQRPELINFLKKSVPYAYELSLPIYLKYLQSNLRHYDVILTFINGGDWWSELRGVYSGPHANKFLNSMEKSFEIAEDVLSHLDKIHLVRLLREINVNNSDAFCQPNITLSDYVPDATGALSDLKRSLCEVQPADLFEELPPLLFASQGYNSKLKLPTTVDYEPLNVEISKTEYLLSQDQEYVTPQRPNWVTEDKLESLRMVALGMLSEESLTSIAFGLLSNVVDGGTLFLNDSSCATCSLLTSWVKQLNLQLFKKQEYDNLLCHMDDLGLEELHHALKTDFHWDMAIQELLQTRNYTKYELNKSLNEFLELVRLHLLEDMKADRPKIADCLIHDAKRNAFGNVTLFVTILSKTARLLRAQAPHLQEVEGLTSYPYFVELQKQIAHNLDVVRPLNQYSRKGLFDELESVTNEEVARELVDGDIYLRLALQNTSSVLDAVNPRQNSWIDICNAYDCDKIAVTIRNFLNTTMIQQELPSFQKKEFWKFTFVSDILKHTEQLLSHSARLLTLLSSVDVQGVMNGRLAPLIDFAVTILRDDVTDNIIASLTGLTLELRPLLQDSPLFNDIQAIGSGIDVVRHFKNHLVDHEDLTVKVNEYFPYAERTESGLERLGINNTNFWSIAAPRIHVGYIMLKPILQPTKDFHIEDFVCQLDPMSTVILPSNLDVVTAADVYGATAEQFCGLEDDTAHKIPPVLFSSLNFTAVIQRVTNILLPKLFASANLTEEQGNAVIAKFPQMASLLPIVQERMGDLGDTIAKEPLIQSLSANMSLGGLLQSSQFQASAGNMLCGTPLPAQDNRLFNAIAESPDFTEVQDQEQLDVLPTDFCRDMYRQIMAMKGGKIFWSFVKPLIMGKILYTPVNPVVERIMEKANTTFSHMIQLVSMIHSFADAFPALDDLSTHRQGVAALRDLIASPAFADLKTSLIGDGDLPEVDVDKLFGEFGDMKGIGSLLRRASDLLRCINLNRLVATPSERDLTHEAARLSRVNEFSAGIVFLNTEGLQEELPRKIEYKIRMDIDNAPTTARKKNYFWIPGPESSFIENMRYFRGFVQLQDMVDKAIIELSRSNTSRVKRETRPEDKWDIYTQQEPYPCYRKNYYQTSLYESQALIVTFFFSLLFTVASAVRFIVADKENGNTMLMSVMGVNLSYHTLSWFIASLLEMVVTIVCVTAVLKLGGILPRTDSSLITAMLFIFGLSVLSFCYMMSKLFTSASSAAVCTAIAYLVTFMPFVIILSLEAVISNTVKLIVCLFMSSAMSYSFLYVERQEASGVGVQWAQLWAKPQPDDLSISAGIFMTLLDAGLYFIVGLLLDKFFGPKSVQSCITNCTTTTEKAGVSIVDVSKVYHAGSRRAKVALKNVNIELRKGQVTSLLGHNGAGKTTLIKILTGMLKPTSGHITIRSETSSLTKVGVCPQNDVLFEQLTAREHVALYAQLKSGLPLEEVHDEVESILSVLSLRGQAADVPACNLSGGTRRRLCVALAFAAQPALVSLDEPTAGVDPAARRDIWSMIVKLRAGRTILLTTHHLDEAELLSDQIVIMHKGQVHTIGSPIEIKRSLGNGYKLSVLYPKLSEYPMDEDRISMEERAKSLVSLVAGKVKNAVLLEASENAVEMQLPLFDHDGVHNDFLQVCTALESAQPTLGFGSYALESSSLEHVFFNVCQRADQAEIAATAKLEAGDSVDYKTESRSKSASTSSVKSDKAPLVATDGPLTGSRWQQFLALLHARYIHYSRDRWLLFLLIVLPSLFVSTAMAFSLIRPPPDNEVSLQLQPAMYQGSSQYLVPKPSIHNSSISPSFAERVMATLQAGSEAREWTKEDTPDCICGETKQLCNLTDRHYNTPFLMLLPDTTTLNDWIVRSHDAYIDKRYGGFSSSIKNNITHLVAWYNNKGHHALPAFINALNNAILRTLSEDQQANITVYSHPLKISKEQISKDTVYQHVADAGISGLVLVGYCLVSAGGAVYLVSARRRQEKRLQLLSGVSPALYWTAALAGDMIVIVINMAITVIVFEAFGFPVFVARNNLPAICLLIFLYGFACSSLIHVLEKLFTEASMANMLLFCCNAFVGLAGITLLLILDIISDSDATDNARWTLHKIFLLCPQFVLADGMLEVAKNTIQAQVLERFGMDTYRDPLSSDLIAYHYIALVLVGTALLLLNLAIEYHMFEWILVRFRSESMSDMAGSGEMEDEEVSAERRRVLELAARGHHQLLRIPTIGNINAGFVDTEVKSNSLKRVVTSREEPTAMVVRLGKVFPALGGERVAVADLSLAIPAAQCTALLGQNGAGKSTTFAMLTGETRPTAGQIYLNGRPADHLQLCQGLISYCPQSDAIDPLMTVRETLRFYCRIRGISDHEEVIRRTIEMFELDKYVDVRADALSGGNRRKLCSAVAFMGRAPLVLLDEPTSGMDPVSRLCVSRGVRAATSSGRAVLLSTHALHDARRLAARVALMRDGRLCALASLDDCLKRFGGGYVIACRCVGSPVWSWRRISQRAPAARLTVLHHAVLHLLLPAHATVNGKEVTTKLSDVFRLMGELQATCDIEDFTVNQSSLDQMFLSFTDKNDEDQDLEPVELDPLPTVTPADELSSITTL